MKPHIIVNCRNDSTENPCDYVKTSFENLSKYLTNYFLKIKFNFDVILILSK